MLLLKGRRTRLFMNVILLILVQNTVLPVAFFMKLLGFVSMTWLKYRIPSEIYSNYPIIAPIILKYRISWHHTPHFSRSFKDTLENDICSLLISGYKFWITVFSFIKKTCTMLFFWWKSNLSNRSRKLIQAAHMVLDIW